MKAFSPLGPTIEFLANTAAPAPVQATLGKNVSAADYRIFNDGDATAVIAWGGTADSATSAILNGLPGPNVLKILPKSAEVIRLSKELFFTGTSSQEVAISITLGEGL